MAKLIPAAERITRARALIQKAREVPVPEDTGRWDLNYVATVKDLLREARDLIKFISYSPTGKTMKDEVAQIVEETRQAEKEILHGS